MPPKPPDRAWNSMKSDRQLMELAKIETLGDIAEQLNRSPAAILRKAQVGPRNQARGPRKMKPRPQPRLNKGTWYVTFEARELGQRGRRRATETFSNEQEAKAFAGAKLAEGSNVNTGTINPHQPKRTITSTQVINWLEE
jgi:hypothetical protein